MNDQYSFANIRKEHDALTNDWRVFGQIVNQWYQPDPNDPTQPVDPSTVIGSFDNPDADGVPQGTSLFGFFTTSSLELQEGWVDEFLQRMAWFIVNAGTGE
jgi:hypothetical protein